MTVFQVSPLACTIITFISFSPKAFYDDDDDDGEGGRGDDPE